CFGRSKNGRDNSTLPLLASSNPASSVNTVSSRTHAYPLRPPKSCSNLPLGKWIQSVSAFLVWCSTFSQGLIFHPQDAASTFFNEML
ncbi:hypothetical protein LRQ11_03645, partial [Pseudomonas sp. MAFF 311095]|uniref:hypothetical protein n=1 Tax=Pseudomonas petroselini TaxID=2899822 RepID=UPI0020B26A43